MFGEKTPACAQSIDFKTIRLKSFGECHSLLDIFIGSKTQHDFLSPCIHPTGKESLKNDNVLPKTLTTQPLSSLLAFLVLEAEKGPASLRKQLRPSTRPGQCTLQLFCLHTSVGSIVLSD